MSTQSKSSGAPILKSGAANSVRIKLARHVLNLHSLKQELRAYNFDGLCKSASASVSKALRIKYAALRVQELREKQAFMSVLRGIGTGLSYGAKAAKGVGQAAGYAARGAKGVAVPAFNATKPYLRQGMNAAGQAAGKAMQAAPGASAAGIGAAGLSAGLAAPYAYNAFKQNVVQPINTNVVQPVATAYDALRRI